MSIATIKCSKKDAIVINRCRLYLQLFSLYDLILYNQALIHPQLIRCERVTSRTSTKYWVNFKRPPRRYIETRQQFLAEHIEPILSQFEITWDTAIAPNYINNFYISNTDNKLYQKLEKGYLQYLLKRNHTGDLPAPYHTTTQLISLSQLDIQQLIPIETNHMPKAITILRQTNINSHGQASITPLNQKKTP
jgi:hypothetical protein